MGSNFTFCILTLNMSNLQQQAQAQINAFVLVHDEKVPNHSS